jgi:hypothetical protein
MLGFYGTTARANSITNRGGLFWGGGRGGRGVP